MDCVTSAAILDALLASTPDATIVTDGVGRIAHWNPAAVAVLGHSEDAAMHRPLAELVVPGGRAPELERALANVQHEGESRAEVIVHRPDGSLSYVDFALRPLQGALSGYVV